MSFPGYFKGLQSTIDFQEQLFAEVFEYVREEANIPLEIIGHNNHEDGGINFFISYNGPLGGLGVNKKIKVDISRSDKTVREISRQLKKLKF